jgi:glycosyltransferase involved in cell wall biosynthesis
LSAGLPVLLSEEFNSSLEGIPATDSILISKTTTDFYKAIHFFRENPEELEKRSLSGRNYIETHFSWKQIAVKHEILFALL